MKSKAVIFDIDEVICRSWQPKFKKQFARGDFSQFEAEIPQFPVIDWAVQLIESLISSNIGIIFVTSRENVRRDATMDWIKSNLLLEADDYQLYMRPDGETGASPDVKKSLYLTFKDKYNILFSIDDEKGNAIMWHKLGIPSLHLLNDYNTK